MADGREMGSLIDIPLITVFKHTATFSLDRCANSSHSICIEMLPDSKLIFVGLNQAVLEEAVARHKASFHFLNARSVCWIS